MTDKEKIALLREALEAADAHLDFCGFGDSYERECAFEQKLPELINRALKDTE